MLWFWVISSLHEFHGMDIWIHITVWSDVGEALIKVELYSDDGNSQEISHVFFFEIQVEHSLSDKVVLYRPMQRDALRPDACSLWLFFHGFPCHHQRLSHFTFLRFLFHSLLLLQLLSLLLSFSGKLLNHFFFLIPGVFTLRGSSSVPYTHVVHTLSVRCRFLTWSNGFDLPLKRIFSP